MSTLYSGELDNIDPIDLGVQFHKDGKDPYCHRNDPTDAYRGGRDSDPIWTFLSDFRDKLIKGYYQEDRRVGKIKFDKRLALFQKNMPDVGEQVYVEFDSNKDHFFLYEIVYMAANRRSVVGSGLDGDRFGQLRVLGFPSGFVTFYDKKPDVSKIKND